MTANRPAERRPQSGYSAGTARLRADRPTAGPAARLFGRPDRILGLDTARALALFALLVLGCLQLTDVAPGSAITASLRRGNIPGGGLSDALVTGADAIAILAPLTLVVIAGVAGGVNSGGPQPVSGVALVQRRLRSTLRGVLLIALSLLVAPYGVPFSALLGTLGAMAILEPFVLALGTRTLFIAASILLLATSTVTALVRSALTASGAHLVPVLDWLFLSPFPPVAWCGLFLAGLAVGRLALRRWRPRLLLLGITSGMAALAFGAGGLLSSAELPPLIRSLFGLDPAAASPVGLLAWGAGTLALLGAVLCVGDVLRWPFVPLSSVGSLAATAGLLAVGLILVLDAMGARLPAQAGTSRVGDEGDGTFGALAGRAVGQLVHIATGRQSAVGPELEAAALALAIAAIVVVFAVVWRLVLGDGPVERVCRIVGARLGADRSPSGDAERSDSPPSTSAARAQPDPLPRFSRGATRALDPHTPADLVASSAKWTPGQALGKLPY